MREMRKIKRRCFVLCALFLSLCCSLKAQHREIAFEHTTLQEALKKATAQNKILFVDCYTDFCGPCKVMAATVFKTDSVADFFNKTFVSLKLDMLSEDGKKCAAVYKVGAYPTFLLLDGTGKEIYKFVGGQPADKFMAQIRSGVDPKNRFLSMNKTYASGKYTDAFMQEYIKLKIKMFELKDAKDLAKQYIEKLPVERRSLPENWFLYSDHYLIGTKAFDSNYLLEHWSDFLKPIGENTVYNQIGTLYRDITESVLRGWYFVDFKPDPADFDYYAQRMTSISTMPYQQDYLTMMDICKALCLKDTVTARQLLCEKIPDFDTENQQILFGALDSVLPYNGTLLHELAIKIVRSGKKSNLYNYLKSLLKPEEAYEGEKYDVPNLQTKIGSTTIVPFFHPNKKIFWYWFEDSNDKTHYYAYDAQKGKYELYNEHVVDSLAQTIYPNEEFDPLITYSPEFDGESLLAKVSIKNKIYIYNDSSRVLVPSSPKQYSMVEYGMSPESKYKITVENYNLWQEDMSTHQRKQLTFDGDKDYEYVLADIEWLSANRYYIIRNDSRNVRTLSVLHSMGYPEPIVSTYKYELPGDTVVAMQELFIGDVQKGVISKINVSKWRWQQLEILKVKDVADKVYFLRSKRTRDEAELCMADANTGEVKTIVSEIGKPYLNEELFRIQVENKGNDIFVWSDRTGWGHIYHYSATGKLLNPVTSGAWTAGRVLKVDNQNHRLYLYGYGREKGINPNYAFLYGVDFNGKHLKCLTPENASHNVSINPTIDLFVDNYSRIDTIPQVCVRSMDGKLLSTIEHIDVSKLLSYGWKYPEQFTVKAADGITNLYGIMWKPYDFDPNKKYPVVSQVYPGPFTETVWTDFTVFDRYNNTALAQRGIIVVCMGHRGGSPYRDKKYATYCYGNLRDYALADDKCGLEQLAKKYPFIDISRVGIFGHSGGAAMAVSAMCTYPDFYKVGVASSGNHDNTIYNRTWGETYQGIGEDNHFTVKTNQELAKNLKGKLLLVTGESDQNVHPAQTLRLVNELILDNKDFDMLVLPGQSHHYDPAYQSYFEKKKRDYFTQYLVNK